MAKSTSKSSKGTKLKKAASKAGSKVKARASKAAKAVKKSASKAAKTLRTSRKAQLATAAAVAGLVAAVGLAASKKKRKK